MGAALEDRDLTIAVCKRLGIWPLGAHRPGSRCVCPDCFGDAAGDRPTSIPPDELAHLRTRRRRKAFAWEEDFAA